MNKCEICGFLSKNKYALVSHLKIHHLSIKDYIENNNFNIFDKYIKGRIT